MGLEIPSKGDIFVNNINTKDFTFEFIHRNFSCAFQEGVLFDEGVSGGEAKRTLFSRALSKEANILILDEVDTGVDASGYSNMINILKSKAKNCLIIMVSHRNNDSQDIFWDYKLHVNNNTVNFLETKEGRPAHS